MSSTNRARLPVFADFSRVCKHGLHVVRPLKPLPLPDPYGWLYEARYPPSHWAFGRMRSLMLLAELARQKPRRFLEVAANDAWLSACAAETGSETVSNDLRTEGLKAAIQNYTTNERMKVAGGNLFDLHADKIGKFDLIAACEIIEHVAHPDQFLKHLKSLLSARGRLLLTTPNGSHLRNALPTHSQIKDFASLEAKQFQPDADGHLFLFSPTEFSELAKDAGFKVEHISVWGTPLLTGHCGLARFPRSLFIPLAYRFETFIQYLPIRERLCFSIFAVLTTSP
jgi:2-polyprenyl-3-methyl-5-hydroxy-6-metoxy-1,4-benzoquinol methylase